MMRCCAAFWLALALVSGPAAADNWPSPEAAYQATRVMEAEGMRLSGHLYHDRGKERWEMTMEGATQVMILRPDLDKMFMLVPETNMAMVMPYAFAGWIPSPERYPWAEPEAVGREVIANEETTKYKVESDEGFGPATVFFWVTDDGIILRAEGSNGEGSGGEWRFEIFLEDLERGDQPAALFEVPTGMQVMPAQPLMIGPRMQGQ